MYEYGTMKPFKSFQDREWEKRENNGEDEPNWRTISVYMDTSHQYHLSNDHILI
jgi:hypothetical protein